MMGPASADARMTRPPLPTRFALVLASAASVGYIPFAPGTFGSAAALPLWFLLRQSGWAAAEPVAIVALLVAGAWSARVVERALAVEDPGVIVIDEVVGMLVTLLWLPLSWPVALAGFFAFRVFDIVKPFPARRLEHVTGGWGVMLDDVAAGVYAYATVRVLLWLAPDWIR